MTPKDRQDWRCWHPDARRQSCHPLVEMVGDKRAAMTTDDHQLLTKRHRLGHASGSFSSSILMGSSTVIGQLGFGCHLIVLASRTWAWTEDPFSNMSQGIGSDVL